jgi:hypothetical protein
MRAFGTRDAQATCVAAAQLFKLRANAPLEPVPTVPIVKVHRPGARVQTRVGIGKYLIDHAAGLPLSRRASRPEFIRPESTRPKQEEHSVLSASGHWGRDETPVVLPLQKTWAIVSIAVAVVLVPIAIWLLLALASKNTPSDPQERPKRTDVVTPQPQGMVAERPSAAAAETAEPPSESSAAPQRESRVGRPTKRGGGGSALARGSPLEVRKRAAPEPRLKSR